MPIRRSKSAKGGSSCRLSKLLFLLEIPPKHASLMHRHDTDLLSIFVSGGETKGTIYGQPPKEDRFAVGEVASARPALHTRPRTPQRVCFAPSTSNLIHRAQSSRASRRIPGTVIPAVKLRAWARSVFSVPTDSASRTLAVSVLWRVQLTC